MRILHVVGARPNFMKVAPLLRAMGRHPDIFQSFLVHTGQHYDPQLSDVFFEELGLPQPDINLGVGSGTHTQQTASVMLRFEETLNQLKPDAVVVVGDVNSTLACALVCAKERVPVAHVEAGLRSFDPGMPEEINRVLTDRISDLLLTPSPDADENLRREGYPPERIVCVGNVMIDTLARLLPQAEKRWEALRTRLGTRPYVFVTLHRPSNVDDPKNLSEIMDVLAEIAKRIAVVFPVHPRTRQSLRSAGIRPAPGVQLVEPLGYLDCVAAQRHSDFILTDSGGIQEESTYLGVPCLTLRPNTERPITITHGTNRLVPGAPRDLLHEANRLLDGDRPGPRCPPLWDGHAAERIVEVLQSFLTGRRKPSENLALQI
ncbi:MAG: UDP-N-acetylglucosamine 2-epimerase (non-hydrolyzing) [Acidobacteriota bacterium]